METTAQIKKSLLGGYRFIKYVWPLMRFAVKGRLYRRCRRCTLSERYVQIEDGLCRICREPEAAAGGSQAAATEAAAAGLNALLQASQGTGRGKYDALLFFSGGKDSVYLLQRLQREFPGLRTLALTVDNGFRSPFGKDNAEAACRAMGVDHLEIRPFEVFRKLYRHGFTHFSDRGFLATDFLEGELFQDIGRKLAADMGIPLMLLGYTAEQMANLPEGFDSYQLYRPGVYQDKAGQTFKREQFLGQPLASIFSPEELRYWWDGSACAPEACPTMVFPFVAWGYDKSEVESLVQSLDFVGQTDPSLTNDLYCLLGIFLDYKRFGYCSMEPEWARYVREGRSDRTWNLHTWEVIEYGTLHYESLLRDGADMQFVLHQLNLSWADVEKMYRA